MVADGSRAIGLAPLCVAGLILRDDPIQDHRHPVIAQRRNRALCHLSRCVRALEDRGDSTTEHSLPAQRLRCGHDRIFPHGSKDEAVGAYWYAKEINVRL